MQREPILDYEEFASLQLDKPVPDLRNEEQLKQHSVDVSLEKRPAEKAYYLLTKGDEFQKLSVIQNLPSLLQTDSQSCMSRVVPKMQQSLATASTEFHIAASSTFKTILEQKLVSHNVFSQTFLPSILNSLESRDPVVCDAWLETLLDVIELLPVEVIRAQIVPLTISKGQLSQPINSRVTCSRLLGKICTRFDPAMIQKEILPSVHSLCQDVNSEVRASICLQLRFVAEGLGAESVKSALLPSLVELASDEESNVRCTSVQTIVYLLPHLQEDTIKTIIVPLVKKLCENATKSDDHVICVIAQEFGKLVLGLEKCLVTAEKTWFLKYFQQLAQMGMVSIKSDSKPHHSFMSSSPADEEKHMECRRCCAFNLPAMFLFVSDSSDDTDALLVTFNSLASDHYYTIRKTVASGIGEVAKILYPKSGRIKLDLIKLLKDDSEEVLQGLVPHIGTTLDCLAESQTIGVDRVDSTLMEIGRALLKCESEISTTHNWRLASMMHSQLEIIPKYFPSDFIYSYFVPMAFFRILHARPIPVRLAAGTLYLFLLRYNMKPIQRVELRSRLYTELATSTDCYVRMMFVRMMVAALEIFSSAYFKEHFFTVLLNLAEDPVANIRIKVLSMLPQLKSKLWLPTDKKLLSAMETTIGHLMNSETDRDVIATLSSVMRKLIDIDPKYDNQPLSKQTKHDIEDAKKFEEEKRLSGMVPGKSPPGGATMKKGAWRRPGETSSKSVTSATSKTTAASPRHSSEPGRMRPQLTQPWERLGHSNSNNPVDYLMQKIQQNRSKLTPLPFIVLPETSEQNVLLTRDYNREFSTNNIASTDTATARTLASAPNLAVLRALTKAAHYNSCWPSSSMPEIPVMLSDDEFLVDAGIRIPAQFSASQGVSKIPHLQDSLFTKRRHFSFERSRTVSFDKGSPKRNSSVGYEDCMQRRTNGGDQSGSPRTSIDCEDGLRLVKDDQQLGKTIYVGPLMRSRFGFVNQDRSMDDKLKRNSLILDKNKPKILQTKCTLDRTKRHSASFEKTKPKRSSSMDYDDSMKRRTNGSDEPKDPRTSIDYEDGLRCLRTRFGFVILDKNKPKVLQTKCNLDRTKRHSTSFDKAKPKRNSSIDYDDSLKRRTNESNQPNDPRTSIDYEDGLILVQDEELDKKDSVYLGPRMTTRWNSLILEKEKPKLVHTKCTADWPKRHSAYFTMKSTDSKETKQTIKCHSLEVADYTPSERLGRALRRHSTLDVNHNQGLSKIPLRSFVPRSRTAPATRASSPVHIEKLCRMPFWES
ncbi:serine/threonine-protein phosphatase 4 regulatory subunit 4 isoform X2 [Megalopta genalis]|uniref:serine/threonine-protein phosphatase 4 regulatory subunit 4 isoform X2 n=1 Tax=Megalopta genalis TaxID=115081 RepID=UPI00144316C2|nr:serine/threonine-protein phosphatase 4 regulatory subunit 4-like isoform X2 [Megalopta genalis]